MQRSYTVNKELYNEVFFSNHHFFISLSILSCSNQPDGDRIMADFVTNVYSKIDSTKGYRFNGYYSTDDVKISRYGARVFRERDTLNIIMNYYWTDEFKEWGFDGWIIADF